MKSRSLVASLLVMRRGRFLEPARRHADPAKLLRRPGEHALGEATVLQHLAVDARLVVQVQAETRQELKAEIPVVVDLRVGKPGTKHRLVAGERREQIRRRVEADLAER